MGWFRCHRWCTLESEGERGLSCGGSGLPLPTETKPLGSNKLKWKGARTAGSSRQGIHWLVLKAVATCRLSCKWMRNWLPVFSKGSAWPPSSTAFMRSVPWMVLDSNRGSNSKLNWAARQPVWADAPVAASRPHTTARIHRNNSKPRRRCLPAHSACTRAISGFCNQAPNSSTNWELALQAAFHAFTRPARSLP